jgi:hypothetical protein
MLADRYVGKEVDAVDAKEYFEFILRIVNTKNLDEVQAKNLLPVGLKGKYPEHLMYFLNKSFCF